MNTVNLKFNPFKDITPSLITSNLKWAGMDDVRLRLERIYHDCIHNNSKQIVLNWGQYGGGKTFSAYYFIKQYGSNNHNLTQIYVRTPKDGSKSTDEFFKAIIDSLTFEKIQNQIRNIIAHHSKEALFNFLAPTAGHEFAKAICLIGTNDEEISVLMNRFLYTGLTKIELKKLGLAKDITTDTDSIKFLSGIISCFIGNTELVNGRVIIWIDEMEDMIYYSAKHYKAFSYVLRDLFDSFNDGFLAFLNFTLSEGEENTIEMILGGAVWSRITRKVRYKQFSMDDAIKYCVELIDYAKINPEISQPLSLTSLKNVLSMIPFSQLTPREINKYLTSLINFALEQGRTEINDEVISRWMVDYQQEN